MADGALDCFTSLLDAIPGWIADLESIVKSATERQKDILRENQPVDSHQEDAERPPETKRPSKSSSIRTRRSKESKEVPSHDLRVLKYNESMPTLVQPQLPHMTQSDALRLAQRKRKTMSARTDRESGPLKYRSRSTVVVYYDGEIQNRFESIVRAIGTRRNALRKGRTSAQVYELAQKGPDSSNGNNGEDGSTYQPRVAYRSARVRQSPRGGKQSDGLQAFDQLDAYLEKAQAQCERAAHQVLRDGDCGLEIQSAKERFSEARAHCETEIPVWQKRIEALAEKERLSEDRRKAQEEDEDHNESSPAVYSPTERLVVDPFTAAGPPLEVDIEPDDSDGGDGDDARDFTINMMHIGGQRPYMQTARLAAH